MEDNRADLYAPIWASRQGPPPLVLRAVVTEAQSYMSAGTPQTTARAEDYVLLSSLPAELRERVKTAVQALIAGM